MLETLTVKNFGIIEHISLELTPQLNILTGETGAGKSILIDALRFCLGERFQTSYLRDDGSACTVEAVFHLSAALAQQLPSLEEFPLEDEQLIIQRTVTSDGKNRVKVNGLTATVAQLKEIGDTLIDFHGPHDHQQLLAEHRHIEILDALTDLDDLKNEYTSLYKDYCDTRTKIEQLNSLAKGRDRDLDLLTHQIKELEQVPLDESNYEELQRDQVKISNAEKLHENISQALGILENDEAGAQLLLTRTFKPLQSLANIDDKASEFLDKLSAVQDEAEDLVSSLKDYSDSLSFDPDFAKRINEQFDAYQDIRRKYGPGLEDAKRFYDEAKQKFDLLNDFEHNADHLAKELKENEDALLKLAKTISLRRKKSAEALKATIEKELQELGFKSIAFEARFEKKPLSSDGTDTVIFFISTNAGENLKPLAEIVSSGEAARIMLAVKRALMKVDPVPVLIFDEIDAQIGGRLGTVIGTKLKEVAAHRQVILITHLPQIAAFAETHFKISKIVENGRTKTKIDEVEGKNRVDELAHMMAGDKITPTSLAHAKEMLKGVSP
jgi:DNA repair protein RecN (Recombination protein N)